MVSPLTSQTGYAAMSGLLDGLRTQRGATLRNPGDVREIGGFRIDVSGQSARTEKVTATAIEPGKGVRTFKPEAMQGVLSDATTSSLIQLQAGDWSVEAIRAIRERSVEGTPFEGMAIAESAQVTQTQTAPVEQVQGIGFFPGIMSRAEEIAYMKQQIARAGELAEIETQLSAEHGAPVKLAWDPLGEDYVALKPGDEGYDRVRSAQEVLAGTKRDLGLMGYGTGDFAEILARYGVRA